LDSNQEMVSGASGRKVLDQPPQLDEIVEELRREIPGQIMYPAIVVQGGGDSFVFSA
jgi:hypothetical protein